MNKQKEQPLVTVAMVTYNSGKYVGVAIKSVLASTYTNFELIISDDASADNTWDIIQTYKDERIRAYRNETNIKEYPNRNKCIDLAKGKYFIFIDGDDYIYPHGLKVMVKSMRLFADSAMGLSRPYDPRFIYPKEFTPEQTIYEQYYGKSVLDLSLARNIFKTEILRKEGMMPIKYIAGDYYIRLKLAGKYNCLLIPDGLIWWRLRKGQASENLYKNDQGIIESFKIDKEFIKSCNITSIDKKEALKRRKIKFIPILKNRLIRLNIKSFFRILNLIIFTNDDKKN